MADDLGMRRVAIIGNAGGGKSTLARELASVTGLPLAALDKLQFRPGGARVPHEEYVRAYAALLATDEWITDGFAGIDLMWKTLEAADTVVHIDLPLAMHALWVTKRLVKGLFATPEGWPEGSPIVSSSISSYRVLWPCHARLTPRYRAYVSEAAQRKRTFRLRSARELRQFLETIRNLCAHGRPPAAHPGDPEVPAQGGQAGAPTRTAP